MMNNEQFDIQLIFANAACFSIPFALDSYLNASIFYNKHCSNTHLVTPSLKASTTHNDTLTMNKHELKLKHDTETKTEATYDFGNLHTAL